MEMMLTETKTALSMKALRLALLSTLVLPTAAMAQQGGTDALEEIVVTADRAIVGTKTNAALTETPQAISVITDQEFRDRTAVDLQDVYRYSAGVAAATSIDSRGDFVTARGFDAAQYLDGLKRMPDFIYGARLETFTLERAEVMRGPSSVLYGAGGPGGILNGASKTPKFDTGGEVGIVVGTDKRKQIQGDVTGALSETVAGRLVAVVRDGESQFGTPDDRILVNPSLTWEITPDTDLTLIGLYQDDSQGSLAYHPLSKSLLAPNKTVKVAHNFYQGEKDFGGMDTKYTSGTAILTHKFTQDISFSSRTRYSHMDTDYKEVYGDLSDGGYAVYVSPFADAAQTLMRREFYVNREKSKVLNTDNNLAVVFMTGEIKHQMLFGIDYTWFKQSKDEGFSCSGWLFAPCHAGGSPPPINIYNPQYGADFSWGYTNFLDYKSTQLGFYVQDQISFGERIHMLLGARRDRSTSDRNDVRELKQNAWSYRGGLIGELFEGFSPYISYSESFLPVPGGDFFGNAFSPRTARQYEGGAKWEPMRGALFTAAYFDIEESNYVSADPNNIQNFIQGGSVGSKGVEFEATIRLPDDYEVAASYSYANPKVLTASSTLAAGTRIIDIPKQMASLWAAKTVEVGADWVVKAGAGVRYIGNRIDTTQTLLTPSETLVDAMVSATYGDWVASVNASNLFNTKYYASCGLSSPPDGFCVPAKDRTVLASLTRKF
ncbi:TonB-dependent siderophore receptor [Niveispirillum sp. KHB5.9]|uniref:TonB-dependent siderophore receptor n=1 Tax=Niveispirillum sp. KHB5.9 TaxID=3400269 RepID=UPI003A8A8918